jgi:hypothetical protein
MIDLLIEHDIIGALWVEKAREAKREKLRQWSTIKV